MYTKKDNQEFEKIQQNISKLIKDKIASKEYTQQSLADKCSVSRTTIHTWLNGTCPTADKIPLLCEALGVSVFELLGINNPYNLSNYDLKVLETIKRTPALKEVIDKFIEGK